MQGAYHPIDPKERKKRKQGSVQGARRRVNKKHKENEVACGIHAALLMSQEKEPPQG